MFFPFGQESFALNVDKNVLLWSGVTWADNSASHLEDTCAVRVKPPPPLSHEKHINALKCNLVSVQAREDVYHLSGLHSLGLTKYQVRIKLSDVMYFHVVKI